MVTFEHIVFAHTLWGEGRCGASFQKDQRAKHAYAQNDELPYVTSVVVLSLPNRECHSFLRLMLEKDGQQAWHIAFYSIVSPSVHPRPGGYDHIFLGK